MKKKHLHSALLGKKLLSFNICALLAVSTMVYSCKKEQSTPIDTSNSKNMPALAREAQTGVSVEDGRLFFATDDDFKATMTALQDRSDDELVNWSNSFSGFKSLLVTYRDADAQAEADQGLSADSLVHSGKLVDVPDYAFASVLAQDGTCQIADTVFLLNPDNSIYAIPAALKNTIPDGSYRTMTGVQKVAVQQENCNWFDNNRDFYNMDNGRRFPEHNGRTVRWRISKWNSWWRFYSSCGYRLKMQKHTRFGGWMNNTRPQWFKGTSGWEGVAKFAPALPLPDAYRNEPIYTQVNYGQLELTRTLVWYAGMWNTPSLCYYGGKYPAFFEVNYGGYASHTWNH